MFAFEQYEQCIEVNVKMIYIFLTNSIWDSSAVPPRFPVARACYVSLETGDF